MSKVEAYVCDYKDHLVTADRAVGIVPAEDAFDRLHSFPSFKGDPSKCHIHYCLDCSREFIFIPAANIVNRRKDEEAYIKKVQELAYGVRAQAVRNFQAKNRFKNEKKKAKR